MPPAGPQRRSPGPVPGPEAGGPLGPGPGGRSPRAAGSGGAGRRDEEVRLPRAEAGEEDRRPAIEAEMSRDNKGYFCSVRCQFVFHLVSFSP